MDFEMARFNMIEQQIRPWEVLDTGVLELLRKVPREVFVTEAQRGLAFADLNLPIGHDETMWQPKIEARMAQTRARILGAAQSLLAEGGYAVAGMPAVAARAGVSTGLIYRYFESKSDLFDQVFRYAAQHEIDICAQAARHPGPARERVARVAETFSRRALKGWRLAYALLAEPVDRTIESDRLHFRAPYRAIFAATPSRMIAAKMAR